MTWSIENPIRIGSHVFAGIAEVNLSIHAAGSTVTGVGEKRPILILHVHDGEISAIDIMDHVYEVDEIEFLYPGGVAQLDALLKENA